MFYEKSIRECLKITESLNLQKKTGLTFDHFRKAFENGDIYNNNKAKKSKKGMYPVFLNYTFTGTPGDTAKFNSRELEGGTSSRICYGYIPEHGKDIPNLDMPCDAELDEIRDQIDAWKSQYCYTTVGLKIMEYSIPNLRKVFYR